MKIPDILRQLCAFLLAVALLFSNCLSSFVFAEDTAQDLEQNASELENELSGLNQDAESLSQELNYILTQLDRADQELQKAREELAKAKGEEAAQYESMKTRIKYMYENNNETLLDILFSARSMADFLNRMTFMSSISEYDHAAMEKLIATRNTIATKERKLQETQEYLAGLQDTLAKKEALINNQIQATASELASCNEKLALAKEKAQAAKQATQQPVEPVYPEPEPQQEQPPSQNSSDNEITEKDPAENVTASDVELLAALIECEAGSTHYEGMLAVGSVVVNRMKSRYYPDTLRGVIFQSGQFPPATNGLVDSVLERGIKSSCEEAARDALNGKNNVGDCLSFRAVSSGHAGTVIGSNVFF